MGESGQGRRGVFEDCSLIMMCIHPYILNNKFLIWNKQTIHLIYADIQVYINFVDSVHVVSTVTHAYLNCSLFYSVTTNQSCILKVLFMSIVKSILSCFLFMCFSETLPSLAISSVRAISF